MYEEMMDRERAENAFRRCFRKGNFIFKLIPNKELKVFKDIQKKNKAYTNSYLGIKNVPLSQIVGSVEKFTDFYGGFIPKSLRAQERWNSIYLEMTGDGKLPPPILYKIKDEYFVYDGNHRISVAKHLNFKMIEAEVYEFISGLGGVEELIFKERFSFEKDTGLEGIEVSEPGGYGRLRKKIENFKYLTKAEEMPTKEAAFEWKRRVFNPIIKIYRSNFPRDNKKNGDFYLEFLGFKEENFTESLVRYINLRKVEENQNLETDFYLDRILIGEFRRLYSVDRVSFYNRETTEKILAIREYSRKNFKRENLIVGEIELYRKQNGIAGFVCGMQGWFENFYEEYERQFLEKIKNIGFLNMDEFDYIDEIVEDIVRFSRYYRKKHRRLLTPLEIVYSYILDIFLPTFQITKEMGLKKEEERERYFTMTQGFLYYARYGGDLGIKEFEKRYLKRENTQFNLMWIITGKEEGDIFRDIKKLLSYYAVTNSEGVKEIGRFHNLIDEYGSTENFQTVNQIREHMIKHYENEENPKNFVRDVLKEELYSLSRDRETRIEYNTLRILNIIRGAWGKYTFIDYYAYLLQGKKGERKTLW